MPDLKLLEKTTIQVRRDILRMVHKVNSGHPGGSLGCAEFFVSLFYDQLEFSLPFKIDGKNEDVFLIAFGPDTLIKEMAPIPGGDEIATISSLNSIAYKLLVKVALLLCNVLL